ncbi:hypothetical protein [Cyanobium sp. NIES-981]|uniref:hypothetical protein n=1 Tax=Cyanobium sp. NIES-981 TaxID=1851505 RepID=UPI000B351723|nr:hypothetical protein [Cyanobium sp. NIES-981]
MVLKGAGGLPTQLDPADPPVEGRDPALVPDVGLAHEMDAMVLAHETGLHHNPLGPLAAEQDAGEGHPASRPIARLWASTVMVTLMTAVMIAMTGSTAVSLQGMGRAL